ncbi:MAG: DUF3164 family protein [Bacteroidota bacterium]
MAKKIWKDHEGNTVPSQYVPIVDKQRDRAANRILKKAMTLNSQIAKFKNESFNLCDKLHTALLKQNNIKVDGKGNYTLTSFDKSIKIEVSLQKRVEFDDRITLAHEKIKEFLIAKTGDAGHEIQEIINHAFQVDKGRMDTKRILGLFKYKITHKLWLEAMELVKQSISTNVSNRYMRIWQKGDNGEYKAVDLNFSSI